MKRSQTTGASHRAFSLAAVVFAACTSTDSDLRAGVTSADSPPNIVLIMADDLGWGDVGFNGNTVIQTPHLDAMAEDGMRFTRFYAQAPVCSPTRGSCLTGRHPYRYGVVSANRGHLRAPELTLAELLQERGYATGHFGKWHLGTMTADYSGKRNRKPEENHADPGMSGFDEWFSTEYAVATWDPYDPANKHGASFDVRNLYWENGTNVARGEDDGLAGDDSRIIMDRALPFVRRAVDAERPFFAVIWFHAPHAPVVGGPEYRARYASYSEDEQHYYACITALDEQVGRLRAELAQLGASEDTLIAFCSDNGPEGNPQARGRSQGSAGGLRGRKRSLYEGGIRVPGVFVWPGHVPAGTSTDYPASTSDYLPTVCALLDAELPNGPLDGVSLDGVLRGAELERSVPIAFQTGQQRVLSGTRFKLVHNLRQQRPNHDNGTEVFAEWELYDLLEDPSESANIIAREPERAERMRAQLKAFVASCEESSAGADYDG